MLVSSLLLPLFYAPVFFFSFPNVWLWLWFVGGLFLGNLLSWLDKQYLFKYYLEVDQQQLPSPPYVTRSLLFVVVYAVLGLFMVTSSGSAIGMGLILGIGLQLTWEVLQANRQSKSIQQVITSGTNLLSIQELKWLSWAVLGYFVILSVLVFF